MAQIFIVEDNELIRSGVIEYFELCGYQISGFADLERAREAFKHQVPDLLILDVILPDGNGFAFARELRNEMDIPIIFLTAREQESDRILGFEAGGDDYVVKPFSNKELQLRVNALLRRVSASPENNEKPAVSEYVLKNRILRIDRQARKVFLDNAGLYLTSTEWKILVFLSDRHERAVSRDILLGECMGYLYSGSERTVDTHIANLRNHLEDGGWIETIRGFGYRFAGRPAAGEGQQV